MPELVVAIDQGTTGTTVFVINPAGRICGRAYREIRQYFPQPGWVEHDPEEIFRSVLSVTRAALAKARAKPGDIRAIGITNQRETFVVWDRKSAKPVYRAIVWQCRRSADICQALRDRENEIAAHTGLLADPYFSGTKLKWLLEHEHLRARAARGELCFGTIDAWLMFRLSRGAAFATDYTNASRTMLLNLERLEWDDAMLKMLDVPREMLPAPVSSRGPIAETAPGILGSRAIPIAAAIGDQQAALFGQRAVNLGDSKATYGTGAFLLMNTGETPIASRCRLLSTAALGPRGERAFALEGSVFVAGAAIQWLRDGLGLIKRAPDSLALARSSRDPSHPYMVPAFVGLGAPYWDAQARGAIVGITRGTSRADIVRAALDSIAYQVRDVIVAMQQDTGRAITEMRADGGAATNPYLMQFQSDILGIPVRRPAMAETTALGAAMLAGLACGVWKSEQDLLRLGGGAKIFKPKMKPDERERLIGGWTRAVRRVLAEPFPRA